MYALYVCIIRLVFVAEMYIYELDKADWIVCTKAGSWLVSTSWFAGHCS